MTFEDGVIGKLEKFFQTRFGLGKMWSRSIATAIVSTCLHEVFLSDELGNVKPNIFVIDIGPSGLGMKSPPVKRARELVKAFNPEYLGVSVFTPPALREWVAPDLGTKSGKEKEFHLNFIIIRDEASTLFGEDRDYMKDLYELLSELWDGYLESYGTRGYGNEGNVDVYVSLLAAGSPKILSLLDEMFFVQGLGNRVLWIDEPVTFKPWGENFFFADPNDSEFEALKKETVEKMKWLEANCKRAVMVDGTLWLKWSNGLRDRFGKSSDQTTDQYLSKSLLNCLKLAINYAASRMSVHPTDGTIAVMEQDLRMAMADTEVYVEMWRSIMMKSTMSKSEAGVPKIRSRKVDFWKVLKAGSEIGRFDKGLLMEALDTTDGEAIRSTLNQLLEDGRAVMVTGEDKFHNPTKGNLTDEEFRGFKPVRGPLPAVFEVTEKGKKWLSDNLAA